MKRGQGISKPVLVLVSAGVVFCLLLLWYGSSRRTRSPEEVATSPPPSESSSPAARNPTEPAILPKGELPPVVPISLAGVLVGPENDQWEKSKAFLSMPRGTQDFGGIEFWLEGVIQLQSQSAKDDNRNFREKVVIPLNQTNVAGTKIEIVQRGSNVASVHLLGATRFDGDPDSTVADLVWRYTDGATRRTPVKFGNHVRDWIRDPYETPAYLPYAFSKVIWREALPTKPGRMLRLYRFSYANPEPAKVIRQLEFISAMQSTYLFIVGVTLDPLKLGERPDDSPNLEPTDAIPPNQLEVLVQNSDGQPIPEAKVWLQIQPKSDNYKTWLETTVVTDSYGIARINFAPFDKADRLEVNATHDDYGSRKVTWSPRAGDTIPSRYTLTLRAGVKIGGVVVDSGDGPITGAKISLYRFWSGGEEINKKGEQVDFPSQTIATDAQGNWQAKGLPAELLDHIGFGIKHTDFTGTNFIVGSSGNIEKQLRAGTFKVVLRGGLEVRGRVTDETDIAIPSATVWAGRRYGDERQQKKTDVQGRFDFRNLSEGDVQFSVTAKGRKPEVKTVSVKPGMEEIVFKLSRGQLIHALVQNEASEPLPGTRVSLESPGSGLAEAYEFNATTDKEGRFEWDGAPDEPVQFYFYKAGYEQKRGQKLEPNKENIVTLRKGRKIEGWVLDATTEKPITKFRVGMGRYHGTDQFYADYPGMKDYADPNGMFTLELTDELNNGIKAEADDYAEKIEKLPEAQDRVVQVVLRLKPSPALRAVLVTPEGVPVAGGTVALTTGKPGGMGVILRKGRLSSPGSQAKIVTSDASGQFTLPSPPESGLVIGVAEMGFATATIQQVRDSGRLVLQTYGRIEGTFSVGGQPVAGQDFMFSMLNISIGLDWGNYKATTDADGRFTIDAVPPGAGQIVRLVQTSSMSWMHSHVTDVIVEPGKTTQVTLGDSGAVLKGHVSFETPPADGEKLTISGTMNSAMPERPQNFQNAEAAQAFFSSPEWQAQMKQMKHFGVSVNADGSVMLDSIPPGTYTLNITATKPGLQPWQGIPVAQGQTTVTVPENANPSFPISLGEIILKPPPQPQAGQLVPR